MSAIQNQTPIKWWKPWLIGALVATLVLVFVFTFTEACYDGNDDAAILRTTMGNYGILPTFHYYLQGFLLYPLNALTTVFPTIAWFSVFQISCLWLSMAAMIRGLMCAFHHQNRNAWWGALTGTIVVIAYMMIHCSRITYTITAAMLGAAGVMQIMAVDCKNGTRSTILRGMILALVFVLLGHSLRPQNTLPTLFFCSIAFLWQWLAHRLVDSKPMWQSALIVLITFCCVWGGRAIEIQVKGMQDYCDWQDARIAVVDYGKLDNLPEELLAKINWSPELYQMVRVWYFMDCAVTTEAFETILAYHDAQQPKALSQTVLETTQTLEQFWRSSPLTVLKIKLCGLLVLLCLLGIVSKRNGMLVHGLALLACVMGTLLMIVYLAYVKRIPDRAVVSALYPAMMLVLGLLPACLPSSQWFFKSVSAVVIIGAVWLCVQCTMLSLDEIIPEEIINDENEGLEAFVALNDLALQWEDTLYLTDDSLIASERLFPDMSEGTATNILFWGGWPYRSPEYTALLERYGININTMDGSVFVNNPNMLLSRVIIDPLPSAFLAYLKSVTGNDVTCYLMDEWGGAYTFELYHATLQ